MIFRFHPLLFEGVDVLCKEEFCQLGEFGTKNQSKPWGRYNPSRELINISPKNEDIFEDDFPFPQVGYVSFLEGSI